MTRVTIASLLFSRFFLAAAAYMLASTATAQVGGPCSACCTSNPQDGATGSIPAGCFLVIFPGGPASDGSGNPENCATCEPCTWGISVISWSCPAGTHALELCRPAGCAGIGAGPYNRPGKLTTNCDATPDFVTANIWDATPKIVYSRTLVLWCGCTGG